MENILWLDFMTPDTSVFMLSCYRSFNNAMDSLFNIVADIFIRHLQLVIILD